jgi:hypothetical protein
MERIVYEQFYHHSSWNERNITRKEQRVNKYFGQKLYVSYLAAHFTYVKNKATFLSVNSCIQYASFIYEYLKAKKKFLNIINFLK